MPQPTGFFARLSYTCLTVSGEGDGAVIVVMLLIMLVNGLLLFAAGQLLDTKVRPIRILLGSVLAAILNGLTMLPGTFVTNHIFWRLVFLVTVAIATFGFARTAWQPILLYCLLNLSLGSLSSTSKEMISSLLGAAGIGFACLIVGRKKVYVPVEVKHKGHTLHLTALRDTGHSLRDPITGKTVLIVDAEAAQKLTGLSPEMLQNPVKAMGTVPGLRLIPYKTVGNAGFLLAIQIQNVKVGHQHGTMLVALSPTQFGSKYQALTGGSL